MQKLDENLDWRAVLDRAVDQIEDQIRAVRRHLHANPEPSGEEYETTAFLAKSLQESGIECSVVESRRGIIAGQLCQNEPCVAMRADTDALRIQEERDVPYRSTRDGLMHACGHDAHSAMVFGAALALHLSRENLPWEVNWRAIFQPAEESAVGAEEMTKYGAVQSVQAIIALHVDPELPVGRIATRIGPLTAFCESINVNIRGKGGHAARPHHTVDSIATAIQLVNSIYQFIPRSIDSREPVVVSFGVIEGGENPNVIPEKVLLRGTIRTVSRVASARVKERIRGIARGLSDASGATIDVEFQRGPDAVINDEWVTGICVLAATELLGKEAVETIRLPSMGGEDFSAYLAHTPGSMLRLGVGGTNSPFLHSSQFDIDETALPIGAKLLARSLVLLSRPRDRELL